jgi:hypothetical protein
VPYWIAAARKSDSILLASNARTTLYQKAGSDNASSSSSTVALGTGTGTGAGACRREVHSKFDIVKEKQIDLSLVVRQQPHLIKFSLEACQSTPSNKDSTGQLLRQSRYRYSGTPLWTGMEINWTLNTDSKRTFLGIPSALLWNIKALVCCQTITWYANMICSDSMLGADRRHPITAYACALRPLPNYDMACRS